MLPGMATDSESIVKPDSEKKLLCVKYGLRTKSCTQSRTPRTCFSLMAIRSRLIKNLWLRVAEPRITSAVKWNTWNITVSRTIENNTWNFKTTCMFGYDTYFTQVLTSMETNLCRTERQEVPYVRVVPRGLPQRLPLFLHKKLVFSPARFNFAPFGPPFL